MKNYEVGKVYIWQNQVGDYAVLNGQETTVVAPAIYMLSFTGMERTWPTDTPCLCGGECGGLIGALVGDLLPKDAPSGEKSVLEMFKKKPELEPA